MSFFSVIPVELASPPRKRAIFIQVAVIAVGAAFSKQRGLEIGKTDALKSIPEIVSTVLARR
jgi:hypothetical protein